jgi:hypothetical protein
MIHLLLRSPLAAPQSQYTFGGISLALNQNRCYDTRL